MTHDFDTLADGAQARWSAEAHELYAQLSSEISSELDERAQLGAQLASARTALSFTQHELARRTGIHQAEISRIERGLANPTAATMLKLAAALGQKLTLTPTIAA